MYKEISITSLVTRVWFAIYILHGAMPVIMHASTGLQDKPTPRHGDEAGSGRFIRPLLKTATIISLRKAQFSENI